MFRQNRPVRHRRRAWARILGVIFVIILILTAASIYIRHVYYRDMQPVSYSQKMVLFVVDKGTTSSKIGDDLYSAGLIRSSAVFKWYVNSHDARQGLQAGTYALRPSMSMPDIVRVLQNGRIASKLVTILPGQRLDEIRQTLINAGFTPSAVDAALDPSHYAANRALVDKPASASLEGFLYPDSYQKDENTRPETIVTESLNAMAEHLTPSIRASFTAQGLNVFQGVVLASIVEKEVSRPEDQTQAAQVFLKRLHSGMALGSDVTAFYGAIKAEHKPSTTYDSPYNTLLYKGLPPGPISNISTNSLQAVAHPAATDWLYFVAGDDGVTHFSKTLAEHEALTKQYCHKLCTAAPR